MSWLRARWNKDNFWNLMFLFGITANMALVDLFANFIPILALTFFILGITLIPYLLAKPNKVTLTDDKVFINKRGESLENRYPKYLPIVVPVTIAVSINCFFAVNKNFPDLKESMAIYAAIGLTIPVLYFIILNCPISILFNKNAWNEKVTGIKPTATPKHHNAAHEATKRIIDYKYRYLPGNVYHRR